MAYKQAGPHIEQALAELLDYVRDAEEAAYRESRHRRGRDDYNYAPEAAPNYLSPDCSAWPVARRNGRSGRNAAMNTRTAIVIGVIAAAVALAVCARADLPSYGFTAPPYDYGREYRDCPWADDGSGGGMCRDIMGPKGSGRLGARARAATARHRPFPVSQASRYLGLSKN